VGPAARRYRSTAARPALSSKCEQCHVVSRRRKLNTDLLAIGLRRLITYSSRPTVLTAVNVSANTDVHMIYEFAKRTVLTLRDQ